MAGRLLILIELGCSDSYKFIYTQAAINRALLLIPKRFQGGIMMRQQEVFFEKVDGVRRVEVLKTYDSGLAREAFSTMDEAALHTLWKSLDLDGDFDPTDEDALWSELLESAREDGNILSFFVVSETSAEKPIAVYVSPDYPSAQAFAESFLK
jgi:hypothetical protein